MVGVTYILITQGTDNTFFTGIPDLAVKIVDCAERKSNLGVLALGVPVSPIMHGFPFGPPVIMGVLGSPEWPQRGSNRTVDTLYMRPIIMLIGKQ